MLKKSLLIIFLSILSLSAFTEEITSQTLNKTESQETLRNTVNEYYPFFLKLPTDKYYSGWMDRRAPNSAVFFNHNFNLSESFFQADPNYPFVFDDVQFFLEGRVASELSIYRNRYFTLGATAAMEALMFQKDQKIGNINIYTYDWYGELSLFFDFWLKPLTGIDLKIRLTPLYHQSSHYVDGYVGIKNKMGNSFEFFGLSLHYNHRFNNHSFSPYGGIEATYRHAGNGVPAVKIHVGHDYRYLISAPLDMNFIYGFNVAYIHDYPDSAGLTHNPNHVAFATAIGIEFHNFRMGLKYRYERGRGATTYFNEQSALGLEISVLL